MASNPGQLIRRERKRLGLRQQDLADALGRHVKTIANWESGRTTPNDDELPSIGQALGCAFVLDANGEWAASPATPPRIEGAVPISTADDPLVIFFHEDRFSDLTEDERAEAAALARHHAYRAIAEIRRRRDEPTST